MLNRNENPYRSPQPIEDKSRTLWIREPETKLLLTMGLIMGIELVGVPLLLVLVLSFGYRFSGELYWFVFIILTGAAVLAGLMFARLLMLAKPDESDEHRSNASKNATTS